MVPQKEMVHIFSLGVILGTIVPLNFIKTLILSFLKDYEKILNNSISADSTQKSTVPSRFVS